MSDGGMPGAREAVHRAFKTTTSRAGVAPFCCMSDGKWACGRLCDTLTSLVEAERSRSLEALDALREACAKAASHGDPDACASRDCGVAVAVRRIRAVNTAAFLARNPKVSP